MLALAVLRITTSMSMLLRIARAIGPARNPEVPPQHCTHKPGMLLRLSKPTDWDLALELVLVAVIETLVR